MAEELRLWKYTAGNKAQDWVADAAYITATEDVLLAVEEAFKITIDGPASDAEIALNPKRIEYRPDYPRRSRRRFLGEKDAEYLALVTQGKVDEADARADVLIATDDARKAPP